VAAPIAYEQPTLMKAWRAFVAHLPIIIFVYITTKALNVLGERVRLGLRSIEASSSHFHPGQVYIPTFDLLFTPDPAGIHILNTIFSWGFWLSELARLSFFILSLLVGLLFVLVPVLYYETGKIISMRVVFGALLGRPWRYLLAGLAFLSMAIFGLFLCFLPGIAVALVSPIYVNKVFMTDMKIKDAIMSSCRSAYLTRSGRTFVGIELMYCYSLLAAIYLFIRFVFPHGGLGQAIVFAVAAILISVFNFYVQNALHRLGVLP
jgi:hypothetical protein